jgi:hypothetical protein
MKDLINKIRYVWSVWSVRDRTIAILAVIGVIVGLVMMTSGKKMLVDLDGWTWTIIK